MTFNSGEKQIKEKLRDFEREDLEEYCQKNNISGSRRNEFIENSIKSVIETENGGGNERNST